jgi:tripartite-type tricarboxylate transporter receptor subunit TctC
VNASMEDGRPIGVARRWVAVAALALLIALPAGAAAQTDWPSHPIRIVVGFGAGGGTDIAARIIAQPLSEILGATVVVENRVGAGGTTAANAVATAPKDGYTALMMSNAHVIAPVIYKSIPYDAVNDFEMISMVGTAGLIVVTHPDFPAKNLNELISVLKASPGKYNYASPGVGTTQHFAVELMNQMAGVQITHVPFRGTPAALAALSGKQVDVVLELIQPVLGQVQSGSLRAIAVTSAERFPSVPDVPTFAESGLPGYDVTSWYGLALPAGTPQPIVRKMTDALRQALARENIAQQIRTAGALPKSSTPQELKDHVVREIKRWTEVRDRAGIPQQ